MTSGIYLTSIIFIVQGIIPSLNKNPNACSGRVKQPGYAYQVLRRRRRLLEKYVNSTLKRESG